MSLIIFILTIVMIVALIWPSKVLSFIPVSNAWRRVIAVVGWFVIGSILASFNSSDDSQTSNEDLAAVEAVGTNTNLPSSTLSVYERLQSDSTLLSDEAIFNPSTAETANELGIKYGMLTGLASKDRYNDRNPLDSVTSALLEKNLKKANKLITKLQPAFRKQYVKLLGNALWEHDIEVQASNNYKTITFIGGTFARNINIKDFHNEAYEMLKLLGFTRAEYKWYKYDDEYTYYTIE